MTNQYFLARIAGRNPNLRAADADREQVADRLRKGHAEGRLDLTEFQQRLERCYESKTYGELDELLRDLPRPEEPDERQSLGAYRHWRMVGLAPLLIVLLLVTAAGGHHGYYGGFWLWIPLLFIVWRLSWWRRRRRWPGRGPTL
jgi:hypothetical protein